MIDERFMGKDMDGNGRGIQEGLMKTMKNLSE
jgi:hypothetical protein